MYTVDACHLEDTQAALEKIKALVHLLQETAEQASNSPGPDQATLLCLNMNLFNVYDLLSSLYDNLTRIIETAYKSE